MSPQETQPVSSGSGKNIGMAVLCYFGILILIPALTEAKNDAFVKFHIKQGLVLIIAGVAVGIISWIPFVGWAAGILLFILWLIGVINAASGKEEHVPVIGKLGDSFKF
jgi:uncharacterized membrane protein